jgi:hypothetical protein
MYTDRQTDRHTKVQPGSICAIMTLPCLPVQLFLGERSKYELARLWSMTTSGSPAAHDGWTCWSSRKQTERNGLPRPRVCVTLTSILSNGWQAATDDTRKTPRGCVCPSGLGHCLRRWGEQTGDRANSAVDGHFFTAGKAQHSTVHTYPHPCTLVTSVRTTGLPGCRKSRRVKLKKKERFRSHNVVKEAHGALIVDTIVSQPTPCLSQSEAVVSSTTVPPSPQVQALIFVYHVADAAGIMSPG